ncbi:MAG TPA: hypothetical protein DDW65_04295 [Firmicutes bacterium]|jgi:branched-chain amino acid transport system substrate-binding protein|nr:hypothetical protein [Bacillota bacterium]
MKKFVFKVFVVLALCSLVIGVNLNVIAAPKVVRIGFLNPLSGSNADAGQQDLNAAKLAVEDINNSGGIKSLKAKVELVIEDSTSDAKEAASAAQRLFTTKKVAGALGTGISGLTMPIQPIVERYRIPIVTNSVNDDITSKGYTYTFQVTPKGSQFGETQVNFFKYINDKYKLGLTKAAIVYENSGYGVSTAEGIQTLAQKAGLKVVLYQPYPHGFTDAGPLVTTIKSSGAEILFPVAYTTDAVLIINTMKAMNVSPLIIGGGAGFLWPAISEALGKNVNGLISVASWNWDSKNITEDPNMVAITERYEKKFGGFMTEHAGPSYLGVRLIAEAVDRAHSDDPVKVAAQMRKLSLAKGTIGAFMQPGRVKFEASGWNTTHPVMIQWQDNKPRTVYPEASATRSFDPSFLKK